MKSVKTSELKAGDWAAHVLDLPNCGGIQVSKQGQIERVEACDMWGTPSETHTSLWMLDTVITVHNSHTWLVRES